jgi:prepilin-type N-terminal cleavage/methylation domain-containing protein
MAKRGFTLIEVLVVIGLITIIASIGLFVSIDTYHDSTFHNSRDLLVSALQHARALAVNNVCVGTCTDGKPHGVHIVFDTGSNVSKFIVFQGTVYNPADTNNISFEIKKNVSATFRATGITDVYFTELSGNPNTTGNINLSDNLGENSVITIGSEGQILWTN